MAQRVDLYFHARQRVSELLFVQATGWLEVQVAALMFGIWSVADCVVELLDRSGTLRYLRVRWLGSIICAVVLFVCDYNLNELLALQGGLIEGAVATRPLASSTVVDGCLTCFDPPALLRSLVRQVERDKSAEAI